MIRVEIEEIIHRPVEEVFHRLVDIDGYPDWMPEGGLLITCWKDSDEPVEVGTRYIDRTRLGTVRGEVAELDPPKRVVFHYTARLFGLTMMQGWPGYTLHRVRDGVTRVHHMARGRLHGAFKLLHPVIQRIAQAERRRTVEALKASLEADTA